MSELAEALAAFQAEMPTVPKAKTARVATRDGGSYSYSYADLADITELATPLLAKHGLSFSCAPRVARDGRITLTGRLLHKSGESIRGQLPIYGSQPQQVGSSLTYARRYLLGCLTGIVTDTDDDGALAKDAAEAKPPPQKRTTVRRRSTKGRQVEDSELPAWQAPLDPWANPEAPGKPPVAAPHGQPRVAPQTDETPQKAPETPQDGAGAPDSARLGDSLRRSLMAASSRLGIDPTQDRQMRLALWSALLGRQVETSNTLTRDEALKLLRRMNDCETGTVEWDYSVETGAVTLRRVESEPPDDYSPRNG